MLPIEEIDFGKAVDELFAPTDARKQADLNKTARNTDPQCAGIDLGALAAGRWAVEYDLRTAPDSFVKHWEYLRDALQKSKTISVLPITGSSLSHQSVGRPPP